MRRQSGIVFVFFLVLGYCGNVLAQKLPTIQVKNSKLFVNDVEFIVKGVNYSPAPLGQSGMSNGYGGTGFCSSKVTPWGEWKSACYDSDYYDGSPDIYTPSRFPNGFKPIWERDFPKMKALGVNTIRLYNTNPSTKAATQQYTNLFKAPAGKDHTQFIKYCEENGFFVIYPLFSDEPTYNSLDEYSMKRYLRWQIDEVGNSSSILMWQFANEMHWSWWGSDVIFDANLNAKFNRYLTYIRRYTLSKWGRSIPVTAAIPNYFEQYNYQFQNWHVDIFSANVFFNTYDDLFKGNSNFKGITSLSCTYNKPFLMTEVGPTWASGVPYNKGAFNEIWYNVVKNIPNGLIGAVWFEHTDEPAIGKDFGFFGFQTNTLSNGQSSTQQDVFIPDKIVTKQQYNDALSGKWNNKNYNMPANIFTLLNRSPTHFSNVTDRCANRGLKSCPGTTYPRCSGNGICDRSVGTCTCANGWSGTTCSTAVCPKSSSGAVCSGRGICSSAVTPPECACNYGYYGKACESTTSSVAKGKCPNNCSYGSGICQPTASGAYYCACHPGWSGVDCSIHDFGTGTVAIQQHYYGCLKTPALSFTAPATSSLTNQKCRYFCASRDFVYAGTSDGNKCMCGNTLASTSTSTSCSSACNGDSSQACGGVALVATYYSGNLAGVGYIGCFADNGTRDLPNQAISGSTSLTIEACRQTCAAQSYKYAGLQNGNECWCGNSYGNTGGIVDGTECSVPCAGDAATYCGAPWRNTVYTATLPAGYVYY